VKIARILSPSDEAVSIGYSRGGLIVTPFVAITDGKVVNSFDVLSARFFRTVLASNASVIPEGC
jgi:hypothetical protein